MMIAESVDRSYRHFLSTTGINYISITFVQRQCKSYHHVPVLRDQVPHSFVSNINSNVSERPLFFLIIMRMPRHICVVRSSDMIATLQTISRLIVDGIFVITLAAFVENCGSLINTTQLHGVEIHFMMATFGTWLFNCCVFAKFFLFFLFHNPRRFC